MSELLKVKSAFRRVITFLMPAQSGVPEYMKSNMTHLIWDIGWWGLLNGSTLAFMTIYAARIGANANQIGLISAMPALINLMLAIPSGNWLKNSRIDHSIFWNGVAQRIFYLLIAALPFIFSQQLQIWMLIVFTFLMSIPGAVIAVGFNELFAQSVPARYRGLIAGRRNAAFAITSIVTAIISGRILSVVSFPINYQIVFLIGFIGAMMSILHLRKVKPLEDKEEIISTDGSRTGSIIIEEEEQASKSFFSKFKKMIHFEALRSPFSRSLGLLTFYHFAHYLAIPIFPIFTVNVLKLPDSVLSLGNALFYVSMLVGSAQISKLTFKIGNKNLTGIGICMLAIYPSLLSIANGAALYCLASLIGGFAWLLVNAAMINYLLEKAPVKDRTGYLAWFSIGSNSAILAGTLIGPVIGNHIGLAVTLMIFAGLRLTAGIALLKWG